MFNKRIYGVCMMINYKIMTFAALASPALAPGEIAGNDYL